MAANRNLIRSLNRLELEKPFSLSIRGLCCKFPNNRVHDLPKPIQGVLGLPRLQFDPVDVPEDDVTNVFNFIVGFVF